MPDFTHLHVHTCYSLLDGAAKIESIMDTAQKFKMHSIAITDHGNMYGVPKFVAEAEKAKIKPIIGCEFYLAPNDCTDKSNDTRYHQIILAKNQTGYKNISKLCSIGFTDGFYYKPRIDKSFIKKHREGLIATTCCIAGEIPRTILQKGEKEAESLFVEWLDIFGEDYYIELQRHGIKEQDIVNEILIKWSKKYKVKMIATNDIHYVDINNAEAQDILLCLRTGKDYNDPKRMKFSNNQFYLKSADEMIKIFEDVPEAIANTAEIVSKIESPKLTRDVLLPVFTLPNEFSSEDDYLKHLVFEGCKYKYKTLTENIISRINYELTVIKKIGFAGYFLIVQDFVATARKLGVTVGPGRGSVAGSVIAYCTGITNIDPMHYDLLFERFLNPERVSMPDIDIDFDDAGRQKVIDYVVEKYGRNRVAQIVTFGTMAAKSSIRDVARTLKVPLNVADRLAKLVPNAPHVTLKQAFDEVKELSNVRNGSDELLKKTLTFAETLEFLPRHTGIHAAGIIIAANDLTELIPVCTSKETDLLVTQYDGKYIESVGMLKMDFLGLKTLSIITDALQNIKKNHAIDINIDEIPLDDKKTFELYQRAETIGTFQFESDGMRAYLKDLKPTNIEDLIAMNALYRPGAMDDIPSYINRKNGKEKFTYPHPIVESILKSTFGVIVYQEQVMLIVQQLAGFTMGQADNLRKGMGKKSMAMLEEKRGLFIAGAEKNRMQKQTANDLFDRMAKFGGYGFNRSHSAAYSVLAYQTAYLKANYPAEYMAAVLTHNMNVVKDISFFMDECKRQTIPVLGPGINESEYNFTVNNKGEILFGLGAIKGLGSKAIEAVVEERNTKGPFKSIFDLCKRINLRAINKKAIESMVYAGAFDCFEGINRAQYIIEYPNETVNVIEKALKYGAQYKANKLTPQKSLFGNFMEEIPEPLIPKYEPWPIIEKLQKEKEVTGMYISGHPLDNYKLEIQSFCNSNLSQIMESKNKNVTVAGIVTEVINRYDKNDRPYALFSIEDYTDSKQFGVFSEDYLRFKHLIVKGHCLFLNGKVQLRYKTDDHYEVRINNIQLLSEVIDKLAKSITLKVALSDVSDNFIKKMETIINKYPGKCELKFNVFDKDENISVYLPSRISKVDASNKLIEDLNKSFEIEYKLN